MTWFPGDRRLANPTGAGALSCLGRGRATVTYPPGQTSRCTAPIAARLPARLLLVALDFVVLDLGLGNGLRFQSLSADAGNAWAQKIIDATRSTVEANVKSFDAAATKIVGPTPGAVLSEPKQK